MATPAGKGAPLGVVDMNAIQEQATRFMHKLATAGDNTRARNRTTNAHLAEAGPQMFGYVAAAALRSMTGVRCRSTSEPLVSPLKLADMCSHRDQSTDAAHVLVRSGTASGGRQDRSGMSRHQ